MLHPSYPGLTVEIAAVGFAVGGAHPDECGPAGMVFGPGDAWLVANCGTGELFSLTSSTTAIGSPLNARADALDLTVGDGGKLFGSCGSLIAELDPRTGAHVRVVADGFSELAGLVYEERRRRLIAADFVASSIVEVEPESGRKRLLAAGAHLGCPDGLVLDSDGRVYAAGYRSRHLVAVDGDGEVSDLGFLPGGPDGVALGDHDGPLADAVIVNQRDGSVVALNADGSLAVLAEGGTPGDLMAVDPDGYLCVTQHHEVLRIGPPWFARQPWRYLSP